MTPKHGAFVDFDPRDSSLFVDGRHESVFSRLRKSHTLCIDSTGVVPIYSLVRYADISRAYKEPELFSPGAGLTLDAFDPARAKSLSKMLETAASDRHRVLRGAMQGAFRGASLAALRGKTSDLFDRFLVEAAGGEVVEFVDAFARPAASMTTTELLGATEAEALRLDPVLAKLGALDFAASSSSTLGQREKAELWLLRELTRIVRGHRESGRSGGLIERLLATEVGGSPLSDHEVALNCLNVVLAGTGATQHTLAGAMAIWSSRRSSLEAVERQPALAAGLIDETLRWLTPVVHLTRLLTAEAEVSGGRIPAGAGVCLWNVSANRDEEVFEDAGAFRPERPPRRHLAFGAGPQHCLGAQVVREQLAVLLEGLLRHGAQVEPAGPAAWVRSNTITGIEKLPVRVRRVDPTDVQIVDAEAALSGSAGRTKGDSCPSP